jgi:hypothetical protein
MLSLGYAGYSATNPHGVTLTRQQLVTNLQSTTTTVTTVSTVTSQVGITQTDTAGNGYAYQGNCVGAVGCYWPYTYDACWGTGQGNNVACDGYLFQDQNGCIVLSVPTLTVTQPPYDHYTLQNLPPLYPPIGSWAVVKGQLFQGPNSAPNGASCPTSYITVSSIQPANAP